VVALAGGTQLQCQRMCKGFTWSLLGTEYVTDAYIVSLGSCDMVLGVQWLSTLGSILWNFEDLTMEFFFKGRRHKLRDAKKSEVEWLKEKIRELFAKLFNSLQFTLSLYNLK